ncbi:6482_t:CDS:2 [Entrophospora sp. SA101]|nr:2855_t:CDS:2 [Entrophospora sp. SA101]CAJ0844500.1 6482_t:CDS:2 [Entrophospora sp. SA101]
MLPTSNNNNPQEIETAENTPLLLSSSTNDNVINNNDVLEDIALLQQEDDQQNKILDFHESVFVTKKAIPVSLTYILQYSLQGSIELAASALGSMYATVTGWSVLFGAATALDTLASQAYTSGNPKMVGVFLQRGLAIILLGFIPIAVSWWEAERILVFLGQDHEIARLSALFTRYLLIGAPALLSFEALKKYLQAQGIMKASTYVLIICSPINIILNYALVWYPPVSLGFIGAPFATSITYWLMLILIIIYIKYFNGYQVWGGWTYMAFHDWLPFLKLALPGVIMVCAEWWAFELAALAAGYLGSIALAAQSIVLTTACLFYQIPFGIAVSSSNRVGNLLGAGLGSRARLASNVSLVLAVLVSMFNSIILLLLKDSWGYLFTEDKEVIDLVSSILPLCACFQISDAISAVGGGILRGQGRQKIGAYLNLPVYYLIAFPVGTLLAFKYHWGLKGLWFGLAIASLSVGVGIIIAILCTDWQYEVEKVKLRIPL